MAYYLVPSGEPWKGSPEDAKRLIKLGMLVSDDAAEQRANENKWVAAGQKMQAAGDAIQTQGQRMQKTGKELTKNVTVPVTAAGAFSIGAFFRLGGR